MDYESYNARCTALKNRSTLKERVEYSNVYIMPELSDNERWMEYELRKSRNSKNAALPEVGVDGRQRCAIDKNNKQWYWGIRWGELRQIDRAIRRSFKAAM
jgi:hypothetical protein